jgi:hypothetical protein
MREIVYDLRSNGLLSLLKALIITLVLVGLYNIHSLSRDTDQAIDRSFAAQSGYNLYTLVDALFDPLRFQEFRTSTENLATVGAFYDLLNNNDSLIFLSAFNQPVPIVQFKGGEKFGYTYGTEMRLGGFYEDPLGRSVVDVKSLQLNQQVFDFYDLRVGKGHAIVWDDVDYSSSVIPVLLGSSYEGVYNIGDELEGWLYSNGSMIFRVVGFLENNSSLYYKDEVNHYLDEYVIIPYPPNLDISLYDDKDFYGILSFAMINGDIAAPKEMASQEVLSQLDVIKYLSGYGEYTLTNTPAYLVQLSLMRHLLEDNFSLIAAIQLLLAVVGTLVVFFLDCALCARRKQKTATWTLLGAGASTIAKRHRRFWLVEYALIAILLFVSFTFLPNQNYISLFVTVGALACFAVVDAGFQRVFLSRMMAALERKG